MHHTTDTDARPATDGGRDHETDAPDTDHDSDDAHDRAKRAALAPLVIDPATAERAATEPFAFDIVAPYEVRVTNTKYPPDEQPDHAYTVSVVETADGDYHPGDCECPADQYREPACKHMLALALSAPLLLAEAADYRDPETPSRDGGYVTLADKLGYTGRGA